LRTLDFARFKPHVVCVETSVLSGAVDREIAHLLEKKGYTVRGGSFPNTIFLDDRMLKLYGGTPQ